MPGETKDAALIEVRCPRCKKKVGERSVVLIGVYVAQCRGCRYHVRTGTSPAVVETVSVSGQRS